MDGNLIYFVILGIFGLFALCTMLSSFYTVETQRAAVIQRFGKFLMIGTAGLNWKWPWIDSVVYMEDLHMQLLDVNVTTKTKDDSIVTLPVRVQYYVLPDKVKEAYYTLDEPEKQIIAHVENVILGYVPRLTLDETFQQETAIATKVKAELEQVMSNFGYGIANALLTKIVPDSTVADAMNRINAARRLQIAAEAEGEATKIKLIKDAEGEAESKRLQGIGIANQRTAIIEGLKTSVEAFSEAVQDVSPADVMAMVLTVQYFDTLKEIATHSKQNTIMIPHSPGAINDIFNQIVNASLLTNKNNNGELAAHV